MNEWRKEFGVGMRGEGYEWGIWVRVRVSGWRWSGRGGLGYGSGWGDGLKG